VLRGRVRRGVLALGLLAAGGTAATLAAGVGSLPAAVREPYAAAGYVGVEVALTGWYAAAWVGTLVSTVALAAAVRLAPAWPEMGARYDAPTDGGAAEAVDGAGSLELWRALDEGRDPTAGAAE
jgi:hypothetical protein